MSQQWAFGTRLPGVVAEHLATPRGKVVLAACAKNRAFEVVELRSHSLPLGQCDVIIVDCINDQVPSRNEVGVKVREPLALVFPHDETKAPQVRALRKDFPSVPHLNHVEPEGPKWLCLHFEAWTANRRTWTAERYLSRICGWLAATAKGELHRSDQPLEAFFFDVPLNLVLPVDFDQKIEVPGSSFIITSEQIDGGHWWARLSPAAAADAGKVLVPLIPKLNAIVHGRVEQRAGTLGQLHDALEARGAPLLEPLRAAVVQSAGERFVRAATKQSCLIILGLAIKRSLNAPSEKHETHGYLILKDLGAIGEALGVLLCHGRIGTRRIGIDNSHENWRQLRIAQIEIKPALTKGKARRLCGINDFQASGKHVLAGVGALGSTLAEIWAREGWGEWTFIDEDYVQPHNIARHVASDADIGRRKAGVVAERVNSIFAPGVSSAVALSSSVLNSSNEEVVGALRAACLIVDATTTLDVPRELSRINAIGRSCSVFLTPSGLASAVLMESDDRRTRLDALEAQYYGALVNSRWGASHLAGHKGEIWVGGGCRDVSTVISNELLHLHAGILSQSVRLFSQTASAQIRVWAVDEGIAGVSVNDVEVQPVVATEHGKWTVVSHLGIEAKLEQLRKEHLPEETGGVIVGFVDHVAERIFVVDILPAPADSQGDASGFIRGVEGLQIILARTWERTARIVSYIGEWHSHPPLCPPKPSTYDAALLAHMASELADEGEPALMIIIGCDQKVSYMIKQ